MARLVAERADVIPLLGEVFRRFGYEGASVARITEYTKLGKGSLYHFFPKGKDEMASVVLEDIRAWFEKNIFMPLEGHEPEAAIADMFIAVESYFKSGRRVCLVGAFALEETRDRFAMEVKHYFSRWLSALSTALESSGLDAAQARQRAKTIVAGIQGAIILARALDEEKVFLDALDHLKGLAAFAESSR